MESARVHEAVTTLVENLRLIGTGEKYAGMDEPRAPRYIKVRFRQPFCMKLGAAAPVSTEAVGREAAQRLAQIVGLPFEFAFIPGSDVWETTSPLVEALSK
jgi:hypothetical protein